MLPQIWGGKQPGNHAWMQDLDVALSDKRRFENSVWILESITWQPLMKSINWQMLPIYAFSRNGLFTSWRYPIHPIKFRLLEVSGHGETTALQKCPTDVLSTLYQCPMHLLNLVHGPIYPLDTPYQPSESCEADSRSDATREKGCLSTPYQLTRNRLPTSYSPPNHVPGTSCILCERKSPLLLPCFSIGSRSLPKWQGMLCMSARVFFWSHSIYRMHGATKSPFAITAWPRASLKRCQSQAAATLGHPGAGCSLYTTCTWAS
jgi:hypothetical protein